MKFLGAIIAYLVIGFILGWGILQAVNDHFWLLGISFFAYVVAFGKIGCLPPTKAH
jgi:hypothetical protein